MPGGTRYWGYYINCGQEIVTSWGPEERHTYRMGDGHVVHSCADCEVHMPMGSRSIAHRFYVMETEAFNFVPGTAFFVEHSQILSFTLQAPYVLQVDHGD